jgi:hypothetical protein
MSKATTEVAAPAPDTEVPPATPPRAAEPPVDLPAEIERSLAFHGTPVAAQVLRDVLGTLGRAATEASKRMPKNRPEHLRGRGWEKASLLALAELCTALAPEVGMINAPRDPDLFPPLTSQAPMTEAEQTAEQDAQHYVIAGPPLPHEIEAPTNTTLAEIAAADPGGAITIIAPTETAVREQEVAAELAAIEAAQAMSTVSVAVHPPDAWVAAIDFEVSPNGHATMIYGPDPWVATADEEATPGK